MRPLRGSFERLSTFEALWRASRRARRGKRRSRGAALFEHELERELLRLQAELRAGTFRFGGYRTFTVHHPQRREIRAAPYRDRVVHHAVCAELEPVIERHLVYDTYACRVGKGSHRALDRLQHFLRGGRWVTKLDVRKYFFTIDHELLLDALRRLYPDPPLDDLLVQLLDTYDAGPEYAFDAVGVSPAAVNRPRGLPIGNLTSQLFANFYLTPLDRFIKEELRVRRYVRLNRRREMCPHLLGWRDDGTQWCLFYQFTLTRWTTKGYRASTPVFGESPGSVRFARPAVLHID